MAEAELMAGVVVLVLVLGVVVVVVEKVTCEGLETLVTSCCGWLELDAWRLSTP